MEQWQQDNRRDVVMVDIDQLVPKDHLLRKIEKVMDYDWLRSTVRNDGAPIFCFYGESLNYFRAGGVDGEVAHLPVVRKSGDGGGELFGKGNVARQAEKARSRAADAESLAA